MICCAIEKQPVAQRLWSAEPYCNRRYIMSETVSEIRRELTERILPFWRGLRDDERGGYTGQVEFDLTRRPEAERGCI